jgi:hypothetical protein
MPPKGPASFIISRFVRDWMSMDVRADDRPEHPHDDDAEVGVEPPPRGGDGHAAVREGEHHRGRVAEPPDAERRGELPARIFAIEESTTGAGASSRTSASPSTSAATRSRFR